MAGPNTRFYVDKRRKKVAGVCAGLAEYFGWDVNMVRVAAVGGLVLTGPFVPVAYVLASWIAPVRPAEVEQELKLQDREEKEFWRKVRHNPRATARSRSIGAAGSRATARSSDASDWRTPASASR